MAKRRRDDDDDDDLGLRTPTKKRRKLEDDEAAPRKKATGKHKRATGKHRSAEEPPRKKATGKHKKATGKHRSAEEPPRKKATGKHEKAAAAPKLAAGGETAPPLPARKGLPAPAAIGAGVLAVLVVAGLGAAVLSGGGEPVAVLPQRATDSAFIVDEGATASAAQTGGEPARPAQPQDQPRIIASGDAEPVALEDPPPTPPKQGNSLEELAARSSTHAAVARILEDFQRLFDPAALHNPGPLLSGFQERQQREEELLAQLRAMGPAAVGPLKDMVLGLGNRQQQIFLGKALAGMDGPEAMAAVGEILGEVKDVALQTTLVRYLPETPGSADTIAGALGGEENGNLRSMLLREYHRRVGQDPEQGRELFRHAALEDPDPNVRAEAVTIIGRRGDPRDSRLMEEIISKESNLSIRQRAIVAYAETGKDGSLNFLENLVRDPDTTLAVRASAVLAIGRVGGQGGASTQQAIQSLDLIAQTDASQEIRTRADRLAQSLRRREEERQNPTRTGNPPLRIDTPSIPVERRQ